MSDGFRISSDHEDNQEDQSLTDADRGELRQNLRESATSRNQDSTSQDSLTDTATAHLKNKGTLEAAQHIANHESPRTQALRPKAG